MTDKAMTDSAPRSELPAHTRVMAQYQRVTLWTAQNLGLTAQVSPPVPLKSPYCQTALNCS
jgi:hypothetical protein